MYRFIRYVCLVLLISLIVACSPEVGSDSWCKKMADTPQGEWSMKDGMDFSDDCDVEDLMR